MEIKLTHAESEKYFYNALCNGLGQFESYGGRLSLKKECYLDSRKELQEKDSKAFICIEDVYMQGLRMGRHLFYKDEEDESLNCSICIEDIHNKVCNTPSFHLQNMINKNDDADTADVILQTVVFSEVIFG